MFDFTHILVCMHVAHHLLVFHSFTEDPTAGVWLTLSMVWISMVWISMV